MANNRPERYTNLIHARVPQDGSRTVTDYRFFYDDPRRYGLTVDPSGIGVPTAAEVAAGVTPVNYAYEPYIVDRYGADNTGTDDSTTAFNKAFSACKQAGGGMVEALPGARYRIDGQLTPDTNACGFLGHGCFLDCTRNTTQATWAPVQGNADVNLRPLLNAQHPIQGFAMQGPGTQNTSAIGILLKDSVDFLIPGVTIRDVGFINWGQDIVFDDGAFITNVFNCTFAVGSTGNAGPPTTYSVTQRSATNSGERQTLVGCTWANKPLAVWNNSGASDIYCIGCSLDTFGGLALLTDEGSAIYYLNGHIEIFDDTNYIGSATGTNSLLCLQNVMLVTQVDRLSFDWFLSNSSFGGVYLDNIFIGPGAHTLDTRLVGGNGAVRMGRISQNENGDRPTLSAFANAFAYGDFESASYVNEWTLTGGAIRSNAQAHGGTWSLSVGNGATAKATFPCSPGQYYQGEFWAIAPAITGTSATFRVLLFYVDAAGASLGLFSVLSVTTNIAAWTKYRFPKAAGLPPAPKGARAVLIQVDCSGGASGTPIGYIDDLILSVTG